jgi:hypothetical protein
MEGSKIAAHIQLILIVTGAATALALGQFVAPSRLVGLVYGKAPADAASLMLARQWGLLVCGVGVLLIYAAFYPPVRIPVMVFAIIEKIGLGTSILGTALRQQPAAAAIAVGDLLISLVYVVYLVEVWS